MLLLRIKKKQENLWIYIFFSRMFKMMDGYGMNKLTQNYFFIL